MMNAADLLRALSAAAVVSGMVCGPLTAQAAVLERTKAVAGGTRSEEHTSELQSH
mgnify:CR=1 FL=1